MGAVVMAAFSFPSNYFITYPMYIKLYGMSEEMGPILLGSGHDEVFLGRDYGQQGRGCSEEVAARVDALVQAQLQDALNRAKTLLAEHREQLDGLSALLIEKETIDRKEFVAFLNGEALPAADSDTKAEKQTEV